MKVLTLLANYTYSKSLDDVPNGQGNAGVAAQSLSTLPSTNYLRHQWDYGPSDFDHRQIFTLSYVWDLPTLAHSNLFMRETLGGWQLTGIVRRQTGAVLHRHRRLRPLPDRPQRRPRHAPAKRPPLRWHPLRHHHHQLRQRPQPRLIRHRLHRHQLPARHLRQHRQELLPRTQLYQLGHGSHQELQPVSRTLPASSSAPSSSTSSTTPTSATQPQPPTAPTSAESSAPAPTTPA